MIRDAIASDFPAILALNEESEHFLSPMDANHLSHLHSQAAYHRVVEIGPSIAAFLLAFSEGADYDSPNYRWFAKRYDSFLYIDRVVVSASCRKKGLGTALYQDVFAFAMQRQIVRMTCEFYIVPPNETSKAFHAKFGFREVGTQWLGSGRKQVSLQEAKRGIGVDTYAG